MTDELDFSDPVKIARAKADAAGPLGKQYSRYPLQFATCVVFGDLPTKPGGVVENATAGLVRLGGQPLVITCNHVYTAYEERRKTRPGLLFQVGGLRLPNPDRQVLDRSERCDLIVFRLTEEQTREVPEQTGIGGFFVEPAAWPPGPVKRGDSVLFGGFPQAMRETVGPGAVDFYTFSLTTLVTSASGSQLVLVFDRGSWVDTSLGQKGLTFRELAGLSGSPVFLANDAGPFLRFDFVGVVRSFSEDFDTVMVSSASAIAEDGRLLR